MRIPDEKLHIIMKRCIEWAQKQSCSKRDLQSFLGSLLYVSKCVKSSRIFLSRMLDTLRDHHFKNTIVLDAEFHKDVNWFKQFLFQFNGTTFFNKSPITATIELDACLTGLGGSFGDLVYTLPIHTHKGSIVHLEMLNILVALKLWGHLWKSKKVIIKCDNQAVVSVLSSGKCYEKYLTDIARNILFYTALNDINIIPIHVLGRNNRAADLLSRWTGDHKDTAELYSLVLHPVWCRVDPNYTVVDYSI